MTDPYVDYVNKFDQVKAMSQAVAPRVQQTVGKLNEQCVIYYNEATKFVGMLINVVSQNQAELIEYVRKTYSQVTMYVHESWMRLDFNEDGQISIDDIRMSMQGLYEFLKNYDYIQATQKIKSTVYEEAQKYMKKGEAP